jgi:membrane associated rhomboid family serine protease
VPKLRAPAVITLIALNVVMFGIEIATGADALSPAPQQLIDLGADFGPLTLHGEPWRLLASMFLHFGVIHIGMNMICLWQGRVVEKLFGHLGFVAIYVVAGLFGGITSLVHSSAVVSAGASGAVFGVFGAFGAFLLMRRAELDPKAVLRSAKSLVTWIGLNLVLGFSVKSIDISAHMGGLVAGFLAGVALLAGAKAEAQRVARSIAILVGGVALSLAALQVIPSSGADASLVIDRVAKLDRRTITQIKYLSKELDNQQITQAKFADVVDNDLLPAWHQARIDIDPIETTGRGHDYVEKLKTYVWLEEAELETLGQILHAGKFHDADDTFDESVRQVEAARKDVLDEASRLNSN